MSNVITANLPGRLTRMPDRLNIFIIQMATMQTHGYGVITQKMMEHLYFAGANILGRYETDWDYKLAIGTPQAWMVPRDGSRAEDLIVHTMFDCDLLPQSWVDILNRVRLVWVPSEWCKDVFEFSGVKTPIIVAGYGADTEVFTPVVRGWGEGEAKQMRQGYREEELDAQGIVRRPGCEGIYHFMTSASTYSDRKNTELVRRVFANLNLPDCKLIVKLRDTGGTIEDGQTTKGRDIEFRVGSFSLEEWVRMLQGVDCYINVSSGEGFSLVPMEAMSTGLPTIVHEYGGPCDYLDPVTNLTVDVGGLVWAEGYNNIYGCEGRWAIPNLDTLRERMLWCYNNRSEATALGKRAAARVRERYTWTMAMQRALEKLEAELL